FGQRQRLHPRASGRARDRGGARRGDRPDRDRARPFNHVDGRTHTCIEGTHVPVKVKESLFSREISNHEMGLVSAFFGNIKGYFVEVGANDPRERSQTWLLEQAGWTGVLVEPQPDLAAELRASRKPRFSVSRVRLPKMPAANCLCTSRALCRRSI